MSEQRVVVPGPKVILLSDPGAGKTHSLRTLIEAGLNVFVIFTEPGMEVLLDEGRGARVYSCAEGLHWRYIPVATPSWADMANIANLMNKFSYRQLTEQAPLGREKYTAFLQVVTLMGNLKCERCNQAFGPADQLNPYDKWCVVNDSLSSLSLAALYLHIGNKPAIHQGEWGVCMGNLERYLNKFAYDIPSMGVLLAHTEREVDEVGGGAVNMVSTLGRKLAPKIPRPFSDVILAERQGDKFSWSTTDTQTFLKTRNFAFSNRIDPTFVPLVQKWHKRIADELAAKAPVRKP